MSDEQKSQWETESEWETEVVPRRNKLLWFLVQRTKQGATREQLLDDEVPEYIIQNDLGTFLPGDVEGMVDWARQKFLPSNNEEQSKP